MRWAAALLVLAAVAGSARAQPVEQPLLHALAGKVDAVRLKDDVTAMVGFGTRHTRSDTVSPTRGVGAARRWVAGRFADISRDCGGCLAIETPSQVFTGARIPTPTEVVDVVAIQRGTSDPDRVIVITGHLDSRVSDVMNATADAPGANDDASGVAALIEAARILSRHKFPATLVYAALTGEEQGLNGGKVLADYAIAKGWRVEANLNNDIVGNTRGQNGAVDDAHVRIFTEGVKVVETPQAAIRRRANGGEVDSPSRNLARYMDRLAEVYLPDLDVVMIYRTDRYGRGGDQIQMLAADFPAVRVTEAVENYDRQHQDLRTEKGRAFGDTLDGVNFAYLAKVTRLNVVTMASLAMAPAPPDSVRLKGAVTANTTIQWTPRADATAYRVWWRATTEPQWRYSRPAGTSGVFTLKDVVIDDWFFGLSAISAEGWESPVVFPGPVGSFGPYVERPRAPIAPPAPPR